MARIGPGMADWITNNPIFGYLGLNSSDPALTGAGEISGAGYQRQSFLSSESGVSYSSGVVESPNMGDLSITIPANTSVFYWSLWDSVTNGKYIFGGTLSGSMSTTTTSAAVTFAVGSLNVSIS